MSEFGHKRTVNELNSAVLRALRNTYGDGGARRGDRAQGQRDNRCEDSRARVAIESQQRSSCILQGKAEALGRNTPAWQHRHIDI